MSCISKLQRGLLGTSRSQIYGLKFENKKKLLLHSFVNSDWARSCNDMRSTTNYLFSLESGYFSWCSEKQEVMAQSTAKAEYVTVVRVKPYG